MLGPEHAQSRLDTRGFALSALVLAWCLCLITVRVLRTSSPYFLFLIWNLFLACLPLAFSRTVELLSRRGASAWTRGMLFCLWLLFLPNAPYIVTDLVHVAPLTGPLSWYDSGMVLSCASAGLLVGYLSLRDMQRLIEQSFGNTAGWSLVAGASMLSGFGVYLGRVQRWNSWDVVTDPVALFRTIADVLVNAQSHTYVIMLLFGVGLLLGYTALHYLTAAERNEERLD
jgi:uncharacterized membrane protein